jgi:hypothetical protein
MLLAHTGSSIGTRKRKTMSDSLPNEVIAEILSLFGKDMYRTEQSNGLLILKLVKSDDVI